MPRTLSWMQLKSRIIAAIENDDQANVFEALVADVSNYMTELKRKGKLAKRSLSLQEDAAILFNRRRELSDSGSRKALQQLVNILKK